MERRISGNMMEQFRQYLIREEKSAATVEKYLRDVRAFSIYIGACSVEKERVIAYKTWLQEREYAVRSINSMIASLNSFFSFMGWTDCRVKALRQQKQIYCPEEKDLTKAEYLRLLEASDGNQQLNLVLQTICSTGIRVSELRYFTVENVNTGEICVSNKGKSRLVFVPGKLRKRLLQYARKEKIHAGPIFVNRKGKPLNRSSIWASMKALCKAAGVRGSKVFPHNLRRLFAKTFYAMEKDIVKLADILGHSGINTTRIYIMSTGLEHRKKMERLGLLI